VLTDWTALLTNPGATEGLAHLVAGALCTGGFVVAGISAYHWARRSTDTEFWQRSLRTGLVLAAGGSVLTIGLGIPQFSYLKADQPAKLAAITGNASGLARAQAAERALHGPGNYAPPGWLVGPMDAMMVIGLLLAVLAVLGLVFDEQLVRSRVALWTLVGAIPLPFVALIAGWVVREEGRQPWVVYGLVRTEAAAGPVSFGAVLVSLIVFTAVYLALAGLNYRLLARAARRGPHEALFGQPELVPAGG
jgi:cytochrome d ubiquinol oxidase subunit I